MAASAPKKKHSRSRSRGAETYERNTQIERVGMTLDRLAKGPVSPAELAEHLTISERTLTRFMGGMERAGFPVYMRRVPSKGHLWTLDVDKYLERFQKGD